MVSTRQRRRIPRRFFVLLAVYAALVATGIVAAAMGEWDTWWPWLSLVSIPVNLASAIVTFRTMWTISAPRNAEPTSFRTRSSDSSSLRSGTSPDTRA